MTETKNMTDMPFSRACSLWFETHRQYIKPGTARLYSYYVKVLSAFFGELPIAKFNIGDLRAYQKAREGKASPTVINLEVRSVLMPILKEANIWSRVRDVYRPLPIIKKHVRKNMNEEEERRFLACALDASKGRRLLAGHCLVAMSNTGMGFGELRHLKRADVFLGEEPPFVTVNEGAKNDYRIRTIPLNRLALRSMRWIVKRWEELGGGEPGQYILPHRASHPKGQKRKRKPPQDFTRPMGKIDRAAHEIFKECGLGHFVPYDCRSHFATKLLSDPNVSDQVFRETFGHADTRMRDRYSKQRIQTKAAAVDRLCIDREPEPATTPEPEPHPPQRPQQPVPMFAVPVENQMQALIQAEISRQVALALQGLAIQPQPPSKQAPRLLVFRSDVAQH